MGGGLSGDTVGFVVSYDKCSRDITPKHDIFDLPNLGPARVEGGRVDGQCRESYMKILQNRVARP